MSGSKQMTVRPRESGSLPTIPKALRRRLVEEGKIDETFARIRVHYVHEPQIRNTSLCGMYLPPLFIDKQAVAFNQLNNRNITCKSCSEHFGKLSL